MNENVLVGMKCPNCGSEGPFRMTVYASALVYDDGVDDIDEIGWDDDNACVCTECKHCGVVADFEEEKPC